jgi:D-amino peptidase
MRVFVSVDLEGVACLVNWPQFSGPDSLELEFSRRQATREVAAVVDGLRRGCNAAGEELEEVVVADSHAESLYLLPEELPRVVSLIRGYPRPSYMMEGLEEGQALACLIGYHSRVGEAAAPMDHSYSGAAVYRLWLDGTEIGELEINAAYAAARGVPVGLVSGDDKLGGQVAASLGRAVEFVETKRGLGHFSARAAHPELVLERLETAAAAVVGRRESLPLYEPVPPDGRTHELRVELVHTLAADLAAYYPCFERRDGRTVVIRDSDLVRLYRAYLGLLVTCGAATRMRS